MKRMIQVLDRHATVLALVGSILLHLTVLVVMRWQPSRSEPIIVEKPPVSRIRILANPNGNPRAAVTKTEVKAQPVAKPKPKTKVKPKRKPKPKSKVKSKVAKRKPAKPEKPVAAETPPPAANTAPRSYGDNKDIGMVGTGISNTKGPSDPGASSDWLPIEQIKPKMPREAALKGIEGFITFRFDIDENGRVENIKVVDAENRSVFEAEARKAVRKFRYRPRRINGRPVRVVGHSFTVVFKLTH
ncbi:energy transducer TonB [Oligoflexus tunisiensis]|uniref:energy transducer TonB n=1 Tax=Oligoflexus tunisiensis TaxID=708132 RepID=UPI00114D04C7|nr:energy transducer TonB [Oligoflexus tunisiensis]